MGKGRMIWGRSVAQVCHNLQLSKDFEVQRPSVTDANILFAHRHIPIVEIYFLANHKAQPITFTGSFRVAGFTPQAWDPETGETTDLIYYSNRKGRTAVPITLTPHGSLFIVFDRRWSAQIKSAEPAKKQTFYQELSTNWKVAFEADRGAPEIALFPVLTSWPDNTDTTIQQFSGTASTQKHLS